MPTTPKRGRPRPFGVGSARVRIERGPDEEGRWYWRAIYQRRTFWSGWAHRELAEQAVISHVARHGYERVEDAGISVAEAVRTLEHLLRAWLGHLEDERADLSPASVRAYRSVVRRLARHGGQEALGTLPTRAHALRSQLVRQYAPTTANTALGVLDAAWSWGRGRGLVPDEALSVRPVKVPPTHKHTPTEADVHAALEAMPDDWRRLMAWTLYETGGRTVDVAQAPRLERGGIVLRGKTGERWVPLSAALHDALTAYVATHREDRVWHVAYATANNLVRDALVLACEAAEVTRFTPRGLRRLRSDLLLRSGVDVGVYAAWMGHSPQIALQHYRQATTADLLTAAASQLGARQISGGEVLTGPWPSTQRSTRGDDDADR